MLRSMGPVRRALDFGSGDGWMAARLLERGLVDEIVGVDVHRRSKTELEPTLYDGSTLPFDDRSFDLVYSVDVFHHMPDPAVGIREALRCSDRHFVLKDHTYSSWPTKLMLSVLDEIGNRRFGVRSRYHYQHGWEWLPEIEAGGFVEEALVHPLLCEDRPIIRHLANRPQFIGRWRRST